MGPGRFGQGGEPVAEAAEPVRHRRWVGGIGARRPTQRRAEHGQHQQRALALEAPERAERQSEPRPPAASIGPVPHQFLEGPQRVGGRQAEGAQPRLDAAAVGAGEAVDPRTRALEEDGLGEAGAADADVVEGLALVIEAPAQGVEALAGDAGGLARVPAGVDCVLGEARVMRRERLEEAADQERGRGEAGPGLDERRRDAADEGTLPGRAVRRRRQPPGGVEQGAQKGGLARSRRPEHPEGDRRLGPPVQRDLGQQAGCGRTVEAVGGSRLGGEDRQGIRAAARPARRRLGGGRRVGYDGERCHERLLEVGDGEADRASA